MSKLLVQRAGWRNSMCAFCSSVSGLSKLHIVVHACPSSMQFCMRPCHVCSLLDSFWSSRQANWQHRHQSSSGLEPLKAHKRSL